MYEQVEKPKEYEKRGQITEKRSLKKGVKS